MWRKVKKSVMWRNVSTWQISLHERNHISLSQLMFFLWQHCFFAIYAVLSRFTRFCVEKNLTKNFACGEKKTNIRYVWKTVLEGFPFPETCDLWDIDREKDNDKDKTKQKTLIPTNQTTMTKIKTMTKKWPFRKDLSWPNKWQGQGQDHSEDTLKRTTPEMCDFFDIWSVWWGDNPLIKTVFLTDRLASLVRPNQQG